MLEQASNIVEVRRDLRWDLKINVPIFKKIHSDTEVT